MLIPCETARYRYRYSDNKAGCGRYVLGEVVQNYIVRVAIRYKYGTEQYGVEWAVRGRIVRAVPVRSNNNIGALRSISDVGQ